MCGIKLFVGVTGRMQTDFDPRPNDLPMINLTLHHPVDGQSRSVANDKIFQVMKTAGAYPDVISHWQHLAVGRCLCNQRTSSVTFAVTLFIRFSLLDTIICDLIRLGV